MSDNLDKYEGKQLSAKERAANETMWEEMAEAALKANLEVYAEGGSSFMGNSALLGSTGRMGGYLDQSQNKIVSLMKEADQAYREVGIVRNVVDIMSDFASEGLRLVHPVAAQQRFYRAWMKKVSMAKVANLVLIGLYKWGNVGIYKIRAKVRRKTKRQMMAQARQLVQEGATKEEAIAAMLEDPKFQKGIIPARYIVLPPFQIRILGSMLFPQKRYFYRVSAADREKIGDPARNASKEEQEIISNMDPEIIRQIRDSGIVLLDNKNFTMFHFKRDPARLWADPMILPIMDDLRYKKTLRRMDISVAESIINPITIFKLGDTANGLPPTPAAFAKLAALLKTPVKTKTLIWNDLITVEQHVIDNTEVLNTEKYQQVNEDILSGLGVSQVLINGGGSGRGGGGQAAAFLSVRTLVERLENGRNEFLDFLKEELREVGKAMGFNKKPIVQWSQMNLRDEAAEKRIIVELMDRKVISVESALELLGFDNTIENLRKVREMKTAEKTGIPLHVGPFDSILQQEGIGPYDGPPEPEPVGLPAPGPGRPDNKGDEDSRKQKTKRDTKPQGMGSRKPHFQKVVSLEQEADKIRAAIEKFLKPRYLQSLGKNSLRQLTATQKMRYDDMVLLMLCGFQPDMKPTRKLLETIALDLTTAPPKLDRCIAKVKKQLITEFMKKNGHAPNAGQRKKIESRAWAICRAQLGL